MSERPAKVSVFFPRESEIRFSPEDVASTPVVFRNVMPVPPLRHQFSCQDFLDAVKKATTK